MMDMPRDSCWICCLVDAVLSMPFCGGRGEPWGPWGVGGSCRGEIEELKEKRVASVAEPDDVI